MRIATSTFFDSTLNAIESQNASLSSLNAQLATGQSVSQPSDNPVAFAQAGRLSGQIQELAQFNSNNADLNSDLGQSSQALDQILTAVNSVTAIAEQAANGTTNAQNRSALAAQVTSLKAQLLGLANTRDGNGVYLFSGSRGDAAPFVQQPDGSVSYRGDNASQYTQIGESQSASSLLAGSALAESRNGDGYAALSAANSNTGSATATLGGTVSAANALAFRKSGNPYSISFSQSSGALQYTVTRGGSVVSQGAYTDGMTLTLSGESLGFSGTPAAGDAFTLAPSTHQGIFNTLNQLAAALNAPLGTAAANALNTQKLGSVLASLSQTQTAVLSMQTTVGVALQAISTANNTNADQSNNDQTALSADVSANIPKVITAINEQSTSLNAAMNAFGKLSKLSLFNYL